MSSASATRAALFFTTVFDLDSGLGSQSRLSVDNDEFIDLEAFVDSRTPIVSAAGNDWPEFNGIVGLHHIHKRPVLAFRQRLSRNDLRIGLFREPEHHTHEHARQELIIRVLE